jgi:putative DNA primase/helicase
MTDTLLAEPEPHFNLTDKGNAQRLVWAHGDNIRWCPDIDEFRLYDNLWLPSADGTLLLPWTADIAQSISDDKWSLASESLGKRKAMIGSLKGEQPIWLKSTEFDNRPMLLNCLNGTLDLESGKLRDFNRADLLTKQSPVLYDPDAVCPRFDSFMDFIFEGKQENIHFLLKAAGYTLSGAVGESCFFGLHGSGANGKTTFIEVMMQILGIDFARPAKFSTFIVSKMHDAKYELATFAGMRLVTAIEPSKAGHLDESVIKQITGGDQIMCRDIYLKNVVFYPSFKLWLAMNNKPRIEGTDEGIWRRVRWIPFLVQIPEEMKIKEFHRVLFREEASGILNRLIQGALAWQKEGLKMPSEFQKATDEFRSSQNVIQDFFDEYCIVGTELHAKTNTLYLVYKGWAELRGENVLRTNEFCEELDKKGFTRKPVWHDGSHCYGLTLKSDTQGIVFGGDK